MWRVEYNDGCRWYLYQDYDTESEANAAVRWLDQNGNKTRKRWVAQPVVYAGDRLFTRDS